MNLLLLFCLFFNAVERRGLSKNTHANQSIIDTAKIIYEKPVFNNPSTRGMSYLLSYDIHKDTLYIINNDNSKLVKLNLQNGNITTNAKWNVFLAKAKKENRQVNQLVIQNDGYYLTVLNELYYTDVNGRFNKIHVDRSVINDFNFTNEKFILTSDDSIKLIDKKGKLLSKIHFDLTDGGYFRSTEGISYAPVPQEPVYNFQPGPGNNIETKKSPPINSYDANIKEPFILYSNDKFFIVISYTSRNKIYSIKKDQKRIYKQIILTGGTNTPNMTSIQSEEGNPNFKIGYSDGVYYCIVLMTKKLKVFSFKI